jgi:outer membrane protein OmpA-like peptidoglycan-associated protein
MRKSVILSVVLHTLAGFAALLWLLWYFMPVSNAFKSLATLMLAMLAGWLVWKNCRYRTQQAKGSDAFIDLPLLDTQGPVVLVCGDGLDAIFQGQPLRKTAQGWWLHAGDVDQLTGMVRSIQEQQPRQVGQLSVMYVCLPDQHQDEAVLRSALKTLRQQIKQLSALTGFTPPVMVSCEFSGPQTPWVMVRGNKPVVCPANESPQALIDWQQSEDNLATLAVLSQAFGFIRETLLDELDKADRLTLPVRVFAVVLRLGATNPDPVAQSVWSDWLFRHTCLQLPCVAAASDPGSRFPDAVLPLLAPFAAPVQGGQRTRRVVFLMWLCALVALGFSALNNRVLIREVGADLQRWSAIPMDHYTPKTQSLEALKRHVLKVERWHRQGEPMRYSLGYYPGYRLWLTLQQAIDTYIPPPVLSPAINTDVAPSPPEHKPVPAVVRLDSLSLFDTGRWQLKAGSTGVLVKALAGINAKPGWLIVVAGHTDDVGDDKSNQRLSRQRAESVRDWMRDTGEVQESCFAVQGYGESRPLKLNDSDAHRAANRRVEISLVPQADACQVPGKTTSPAKGDVITSEMEK